MNAFVPMKKALISFSLALIAAGALFSASLDDIISRAKAESKSYNELRGSAIRKDLDALLKTYDAQDSYRFAIDSFVSTATSAGDSFVSLSPEFTYSSGGDNTTSVRVSSPMTLIYASQLDSKSTYKPGVSVSQKIKIDPTADNRKDNSKRIARLQADSLLGKIDAQFEVSVCNALMEVLQRMSDFSTSKASYDKQKAEFDALVSKGLVVEGTYDYKSKLSSLLVSEKSLEKARLARDLALESFRRVCGFDFDSLSVSPALEIGFSPLQGGNSKVMIAYLEMLNAQNEYDILVGNDDRALNLNAAGDMSIVGNSVSSYAISGNVGYKDKSWQAGVGASATFDKERNAVYPKVSMSLSYDLGSNDSRSDSLNKQMALISKESAAYDYEIAMMDYKKECLEMQRSISDARLDLERETAAYENAKAVYENDLDLRDKGYYSEFEFAEKKAAFAKAENSYKSFLLSLRILRCNAEILNL